MELMFTLVQQNFGHYLTLQAVFLTILPYLSEKNGVYLQVTHRATLII